MSSSQLVMEDAGVITLIDGDLDSQRTKALAEKAFFASNSKSTVIRPSLVFGPGDSFFAVSPSL